MKRPEDGFEQATVLERYRRASTRRRCACGGSLIARSGSDGDVTRAVRFHQRDAQHRTWWVSAPDEV